MKRSPLARKTRLKQRTPVKAKRSKPRRGPMRAPGYLAWLRDRKCVVCGWVYMSGVDAAHGPVNGRGSKGPDNEAVPLCSTHHAEQHRLSWPAFEAKYNIDRKKEAAALYAVYLIDAGATSRLAVA
jgi:hypothetical protein